MERAIGCSSSQKKSRRIWFVVGIVLKFFEVLYGLRDLMFTNTSQRLTTHLLQRVLAEEHPIELKCRLNVFDRGHRPTFTEITFASLHQRRRRRPAEEHAD